MKTFGSQVATDFVIQFGKVAGSTVLSDSTGIPLWNVTGISGIDELDETPEVNYDDNQGERTDNADVFGSLGVIGRPLPGTRFRGQDEHAEVACLRTADGLLPIASRDVRTRMQGNGPNEGTIALVGYGGGFHSISPLVERSGAEQEISEIKGAIHVIYCPYDYDADGVAQKAHSITIDPTEDNESISIVHADGQAILLQNDGSIQMQSPDGQSFIKIEDGKITLQSEQVIFNGTVAIGNPSVCVPLLAGPASPPCPRLVVSPLP